MTQETIELVAVPVELVVCHWGKEQIIGSDLTMHLFRGGKNHSKRTALCGRFFDTDDTIIMTPQEARVRGGSITSVLKSGINNCFRCQCARAIGKHEAAAG